MAKRTVKSAKKAARSAFSDFIRLRDCLATTGTPDNGYCITCERPKPYDELDAGHFRKATGSLTLFDERNVQAQCIRCNRFEDGRQYDHGKKLEAKYGLAVVEELTLLSHQTYKFTIEELDEIKDNYRAKTTELARNQP